MSHHTYRLAILPLILGSIFVALALETERGICATDSKDMWESYFPRTTVLNRDIWTIAVDLTGDGKPETLISEETAYEYYQDRRSWTVAIRNSDGTYTFILLGADFDLRDQMVVVSDLPGLSVPAMVITRHFVEEPFGPGEKRDVIRYEVTYLAIEMKHASPPGYLEHFYPDKSPTEIEKIYKDLAARGTVPKPTQVSIRELAKKYKFITHENVKAVYSGKGDPGYRWIGPGLPEEGLPIPCRPGERVMDVGKKVLDSYEASSKTLTAVPASVWHPTSATAPIVTPKPRPITPPPTPKMDLASPRPTAATPPPRGSESHILQILIAGVAALLVLGGVFVYSRRRR